MQFGLNDDQVAIHEMAQRFTADAITAHALEWDEHHVFPWDTVRAAAELGFGAIYVSGGSGGIGLGRLEAALIMEAMAYGCPSTSALISIHNMAAWMVDSYGSAELKGRYLSDLVGCARIASYCLTEPGSGSDAAALKTKAARDGDDYVVTGSKAFISGAGKNEVYIVMARTGEEGAKGISALVVDKDMPGVSFGANEKKLGWRSQPTAQINLDGVRVPVANRLGAEGEGFRIAMAGLDGGRLNIGACSLGGAQRCLDEAIAYTKGRKQFGQAIADFQATQFTLADMETELQAARALLYTAAPKVTERAPGRTKFVAMAKRFATDTGSSVVDRALQLHGGYGYLQDYPIEPGGAIAAILKAAATAAPEAPILAQREAIDRLFAANTSEDILATLAAEGGERAAKQHAIVAAKSPLSCKVTLRELAASRPLIDFADEMRMEYGIAAHVCQRPDFLEGVRALIVDKDNAPRWNPPRPEGVTEHMIDTIFAPLDADAAWEPYRG